MAPSVRVACDVYSLFVQMPRVYPICFCCDRISDNTKARLQESAAQQVAAARDRAAAASSAERKEVQLEADRQAARANRDLRVAMGAGNWQVAQQLAMAMDTVTMCCAGTMDEGAAAGLRLTVHENLNLCDGI